MKTPRPFPIAPVVIEEEKEKPSQLICILQCIECKKQRSIQMDWNCLREMPLQETFTCAFHPDKIACEDPENIIEAVALSPTVPIPVEGPWDYSKIGIPRFTIEVYDDWFADDAWTLLETIALFDFVLVNGVGIFRRIIADPLLSVRHNRDDCEQRFLAVYHLSAFLAKGYTAPPKLSRSQKAEIAKLSTKERKKFSKKPPKEEKVYVPTRQSTRLLGREKVKYAEEPEVSEDDLTSQSEEEDLPPFKLDKILGFRKQEVTEITEAASSSDDESSHDNLITESKPPTTEVLVGDEMAVHPDVQIETSPSRAVGGLKSGGSVENTQGNVSKKSRLVEKVVLQMQYFCKKEGFSYRSCAWHSDAEMELLFGKQSAQSKISNFTKKWPAIKKTNDTNFGGELFDPQFREVDRIIAHRQSLFKTDELPSSNLGIPEGQGNDMLLI